jgi:AraC family transcriptional regulator
MGSPRSASRTVPGFRIVQAWFPPGAILERHSHDLANVLVMLRGSFALEIAGRTLECGRGVVAVEPRGEPHGNHVGTAGADVIVVQPEVIDEQWRPVTFGVESIRHGRSVEALDIARRLARELGKDDAVAPLARQALAVELLVTAIRTTRHESHLPPSWMTQVEELLRDTPGSLTLGQIAREVGHHPVHVARAFRRLHGTSIGEWARRQRLERAADLLLSGHDPLAMIAARLGFYDQSHFTREFRRLFGQTPAAFRRAGPARP